MYLSCFATAEGMHLDKTYLDPPHDRERISEWRFAREEPTKEIGNSGKTSGKDTAAGT
jgi:hypothetical protein